MVNTINAPFSKRKASVLMKDERASIPQMAAFLERILRGFIALP